MSISKVGWAKFKMLNLIMIYDIKIYYVYSILTEIKLGK